LRHGALSLQGVSVFNLRIIEDNDKSPFEGAAGDPRRRPVGKAAGKPGAWTMKSWRFINHAEGLPVPGHLTSGVHMSRHPSLSRAVLVMTFAFGGAAIAQERPWYVTVDAGLSRAADPDFAGGRLRE
jgi:hypothetical protein